MEYSDYVTYLGDILEYQITDATSATPSSDDNFNNILPAAILASIETHKTTNGLDMKSWHGSACNETNWCNTTHCRAGYAICLAGKAGFDLEHKFNSEIAGKMIYAASRPNLPLPDFRASTQAAMDDMRRAAAEQTGSAP